MHRSRQIRAWKAAVSLGPAVVTLALIAIIASQHVRTMAWGTEVERTFRVDLSLNRMLSRLIDAETGERGFILTGDPRYLEPYQGVREDVDVLFAELHGWVEDPEQRAALSALPALVERRLALNDQHIQIRRTTGAAAADAALRAGRGKATMDSIRAVVGQMHQRQAVLLAERRTQLRRSGTRTEWLLGAAMAIAVLLGTGTHVLLRRYTAAQEEKTRELAERNHQLQEQAVELEIQSEELAGQAVELEATAQALAESERRFRTLIENSSDIITIVDHEGRVRYQSPAVARVMGFDADQSIGKAGLDGVHPDDRPGMEWLMGDLANEPGASISTQVRCIDSAGRWRLLEATATNLFADEAIGGIVVNTRDVTDRHAAEEEVRRQQAYLRTVIDTSPNLIFAKDRDGRFTMANAAAARALGTTPEALLGRREDELGLPPAVAAAHDDADRALLETGTPQFIAEEALADPQTGDVRWLHTFKVRLTPPGGGDHQVLAVSTDITERKRAELALKNKEEELRQAQKLEAIGRLAGGVAHDFNNILTAVRGFAQVLLMDVENQEVREDLLEIDRAGERGATLARQLLAFSRKQVLHPRLVDLNEVAGGTHRMLLRLMGDEVELAMELAPEPAPVLADPGQLEQVIVNLVVNARDAMPEGGRITLGTRTVSGSGVPPVRGLYLGPGESGVLLTVADTGHGMDEATRERVFEPFFTTKPVGRGTGLGLSTVYGIVNQSGGSIGVQSAPGEGCTFFVLLPLAAHEAGEVAGEAVPPLPPPTAATTVLLVEDEDPVRRSVRRMLERHGYAVLEAPDPHEALRLCATFPGDIHLLLTDVVMPQVKGPELARRVQAVRPGVRVVFMSGYTSASDAFEAAGELPSNLLEKPFSLEQLLRHLQGALA